MPGMRSTTENSAGSSFAEMLPFQSSLWHRHSGSSESVGSRKPNSNIARQDMTATETFSTLRPFWLKHYDAMEVLIMDQATEFGADFQHQCQSRGIPPMVTDLETPRQISVVERHGALFKVAFEKACSLEALTTEVEVNELIDFTFAELNRRVGRAGFSPSQRVFGRQLRLQSSLLEDDFIDPYMIAQDATHEMRRSEATRMAAAHGCVVAADRRATSTASNSRERKPQRVLVGGEPIFIHRRKDGAGCTCETVCTSAIAHR